MHLNLVDRAWGWFTVHRRFMLFYLLFYAAVGAFLPYMGLYFERKGVSGTHLGLLLGVMPLMSVIAQPFWGLVGDVYQIRRDALTLTCLGTGLASLAFGLSDAFGWLFVVVLAFSFMRAPTIPLGNALALDHLERQHHQEDYGPLRSWGSVGAALTSFLAGGLIDGATVAYLPFAFAAVMFVLTLLTRILPDAEEDASTSWIEGLRLLPRRPNLALLFLGILLIGGPLITAVQYLPIFMRSIDASGWMIGFAIALQAIIEIPLMLKVPDLTERFDLPKLLLVGVLLLPVRWLLFAVVSEPWLVLPLQFVHSLAIVSLLVVGVDYVDRQLPRRWRATGQGLYSTAMLGIGPGLTQFAAGYLYDAVGIRAVWVAFIFVCLLGSTIIKVALDRLEGMRVSEFDSPR